MIYFTVFADNKKIGVMNLESMPDPEGVRKAAYKFTSSKGIKCANITTHRWPVDLPTYIKRREKKRCTQEDLAAKMDGVSYSTIRNIEQGRYVKPVYYEAYKKAIDSLK